VILYLDTSALVKLLVNEEHSEEVRSWAGAAADVVTCTITLPEAASAASRAHLARRLPDAVAERLPGDLSRLWERLLHVTVDEQRAAAIAWSRGLRGMDAIQLAAARTLADAVGADGLAFCSFDRELCAAAVAEGLIVLEAT
jgi:uncharacterized protein